ncbi:hypothetical protein PR001_g14386, partial [Phytophthora rubi]
MSCLGGRARSWAYGRRLTDPTCFSTYEVFKEELRQAFEPPQNEFRSRAEFLDLQQGKHDVHAYAQRARYLVSNIVTNPIDEATKVVTFMKDLKDGPVKTYLFREYPSTLESAITLAMQEEFSLRQAKLHVNVPRSMPRPMKRVVRVLFSYREKKFVDELIVLDLDEKFDMVLGMPWLARHDPVIDWTKHTIVHFGSSGATVSDDPVGAARAPRGARDPPGETARRAAVSGHPARTPTTERVVGRKCESNQKTQIRSDSRGSRIVKSDAVVSTISVDTQVQQEEPVTNKDSNSDASAQGADAIGPNVERRSAVRRRAGLHEEAIRDQAGLDCVRPRVEPAGDQKEDLSAAGPGQNKTRGTGFRTRSERRKRAKLRKSRSGTETLQAVSAGQTQELETTVETLSVLTRTNTGLTYKKMKLENPPTLASELTSLPVTSWRRFARDLHDGRIEQICILSDVEKMECEAEE